MSKSAATKAWDTRRAKAKARSNAAYKAWATRRRLKIAKPDSEEKDMPRSKKKTAANGTVSVRPSNGAAMHSPTIDSIMDQLRSLIIAAGQQSPQATAPVSAPTAEVKGPKPKDLHGQDIMVIAQALKEAEQAAAADQDGIGAEYEHLAKQIRFVLWTRKYSV